MRNPQNLRRMRNLLVMTARMTNPRMTNPTPDLTLHLTLSRHDDNWNWNPNRRTYPGSPASRHVFKSNEHRYKWELKTATVLSQNDEFPGTLRATEASRAVTGIENEKKGGKQTEEISSSDGESDNELLVMWLALT